MNEALEKLCSALDDECERQENVLAVCRAQGDAARANDVPELEKRTAALELLVEDTRQAEAERNRVTRDVVGGLGLPPERQTLSELIKVAPEPWGSRLRQAQKRLQIAMSEARAVVRSDVPVLRNGRRMARQSLEFLNECAEPDASGYDPTGAEIAGNDRLPALIDRKG